jgi:hypothetical protein
VLIRTAQATRSERAAEADTSPEALGDGFGSVL